MTLVASDKIPTTWDVVRDWWNRISDYAGNEYEEARETVVDYYDDFTNWYNNLKNDTSEKVQVKADELYSALYEIKKNIEATKRNISYMKDSDPQKADFIREVNTQEAKYNTLKTTAWPFLTVAGYQNETIDDLNMGIAPVVGYGILIVIGLAFVTAITYLLRDSDTLKNLSESAVFFTKNIPWLVGGAGAISLLFIYKQLNKN